MFYLTVPNSSLFLRTLHEGQQFTKAIIKRSKFSEIQMTQLMIKKSKKVSKLGTTYYCLDLIGSETVKVIDTTSGPILRYNDDADWRNHLLILLSTALVPVTDLRFISYCSLTSCLVVRCSLCVLLPFSQWSESLLMTMYQSNSGLSLLMCRRCFMICFLVKTRHRFIHLQLPKCMFWF